MLVYLIASAMLIVPAQARAQSVPVNEYQLKAVFLFHFAQFVDWPPAAFPDSQAPLVIGILGNDPFGSYLHETVRGELVNGHPLIIQRYRRLDEIKTCHILFITGTETDKLEQVVTALRSRNILTVSDAGNFAEQGGMIQFVTEHSKIRLRINLEAAKSANLTISSKLLRPATIVTSEKH
jgi:hypothetical protein